MKNTEITDGGIIISRLEGKEVLETDIAAMAVGLKSETTLIDKLKNVHFPVHTIVDCLSPRKIQDAIGEGYMLVPRI